MPNDLQLSDQDEVLLESLVLAASDNVARAPASDRDQYAPERRRAFVETSGAGNVYLGTGSAWVDVSENTGLLSKLFSGGDGNFDSVSTEYATTRTLDEQITGASWLGMDPSVTHCRYVDLTIDEILNDVPWVTDHRNPVMDSDVFRNGGMDAHFGGDADPIVVGDELVMSYEGANEAVNGEDTTLAKFSLDASEVTQQPVYIGDGTDDFTRVAPLIRYIPERGEYVMFSGRQERVESWSWNLVLTKSDDLLNWSNISGADPLFEDYGPHSEYVRVDDTIYWFTDDDSGTFGYIEMDPTDLVGSASFTALNTTITAGFLGSITRCRDGWLMLDTPDWGDIEVYETSFADFPGGWTERPESPNPFGFEKNATWNAGGHRNPKLVQPGKTPMVVTPATVAGGSNPESQTGIYRAGTDGMTMRSIRLPEKINPQEELTTTSSTSKETIGETRVHMDQKSAEQVYFHGSIKLSNDTAGEDTTVRLRDIDNSQNLLEFTHTGDGGTTFEIVNQGPFDISAASGGDKAYKTGLLSLRWFVSGGTGTYENLNHAGIKFMAPYGRQVR